MVKTCTIHRSEQRPRLADAGRVPVPARCGPTLRGRRGSHLNFLLQESSRPSQPAAAPVTLARFDARALDPSPYLPRITCRVDLVHGVDDDVIPFAHAHALAAGLANVDVRVHLTGLYNHTGAARPPLGAAARELATLVRVLRLLAA